MYFFLAHWDGWQPFSSSLRGCGAIEVTIATMSKVERCKAKEVYVVGFVPSHMLPKKRPISLDPFLEPLIVDIGDVFISGIQANYKLATCGKPAGNTTIRHVMICFFWRPWWLGWGRQIYKNGKCGCRSCKPESVYVPETSHYYYPNFGRQGRYPTKKKNVLDNLELLSDIASEERISVRCRLSKESGYTGLSVLHRLYYLYGFLYDRDMVYDEMRTIHLNIVKNALLSLKEEEDDIVDWTTADNRLKDFPWTIEFKSSHIPKDIEKCFFCIWSCVQWPSVTWSTRRMVMHCSYGGVSSEPCKAWMDRKWCCHFPRNGIKA